MVTKRQSRSVLHVTLFQAISRHSISHDTTQLLKFEVQMETAVTWNDLYIHTVPLATNIWD